MLFQDYMQKFRPLYAPDGPTAGGSDGAAAAAPDPAVPSVSADPAAAAPAADPTPAAAAPVEAAPVEAPKDTPKAEPSLIEAAERPEAKADTKESPAPAETAKADGDKKPDAKDPKAEGEKKPEAEAAKVDPDKKDATAEPPAPIQYEAFKLPEGVALEADRLGAFTEIAGKAGVAQDVAQSLVDLHIAEMQRYAAEVSKQAGVNQRDVWQKLNDAWKAEFRKDERLGGNRAETTLAMAKAVIEEYGGTQDQVRELIAHTSNNGMGNYPGFIRLLANIGEALNVFEDSEVPINPNPPKTARSRGEKWYGDTMGNGTKA